MTWTEEQTYFFKLSEYTDRLLAHYEAHPEFIGPDVRRNEVVSFVSGGLRDLSISRTTFDWGVPVPDHPDHVMYVWVDALTNYLTGVGFPDTASESFEKYWPADLHMIGKDIIRFHAVYWPAFLMSAGIALPRTGFRARVHQRQGREDEQVAGQRRSIRSTSSTPSVWTRCATSSCARCPSARTAVTARKPSSAASTPIWPTNWATSRSVRCRWWPRTSTAWCPTRVPFTAEDEAMLAAADALLDRVRACYDEQAMHLALDAIWSVLSAANKYFSAQEPWVLRKTDPARMATVLYTTLETVRIAALLSQPVMPTSTAKLLDLLGQPADRRDFTAIDARLVAGHRITHPGRGVPAISGR